MWPRVHRTQVVVVVVDILAPAHHSRVVVASGEDNPAAVEEVGSPVLQLYQLVADSRIQVVVFAPFPSIYFE